MILRVLAVLSLSWPASVFASDLPVPVADIVEGARADCESFEAGAFSMQPEAARREDLTGGGEGWVVDTALMSCSSAASMYCGSGGCSVSFVVGDHVTERIAAGWGIVPFGDRSVLLLDVHGSLCGGINPTPCVEALTWDAETAEFTSLAPRPQ